VCAAVYSDKSQVTQQNPRGAGCDGEEARALGCVASRPTMGEQVRAASHAGSWYTADGARPTISSVLGGEVSPFNKPTRARTCLGSDGV